MATKTVKSVCPYCGVGCGILMDVSEKRVVKVSGDKQHPTNFGRLCTKGSTCSQAIVESGRLEHAYLRDERQRDPVRVALDVAIKEAATRLRSIIDEHGPDAVAFYVSGQMSLEAQYLANKLCKGFVRTNNIESNSRLCMASAGSGYKLSLGADGPPGSYQDFDHADVFFVIGANMADCHPILFLRLMDRVKAGAKLIVVDPRRNTTADKASLFLQIKPGTDLALLNGLLHLIVKNGHTDAAFIDSFTEGWEVMPSFLEDYPPEKVAAITGLAEADIRKAAEMIGVARKWMSCWTMGLNQSTHGTWNTNAICNLHLATGAICRLGSGPFSLTGQPNAMGGREMGYMGPGLPGQRSVLVAEEREFVEALWNIPAGSLRDTLGDGTVAMFEAMQTGKIKACWIICTNPVATMPNRKKVIEGLAAAELVITQDAFLDTETNRYADILLPGALWAEAEGVMINSERNLTLMQQAVTPPGEAMADWQIIARVACEMGFAEAFSYHNASEVFDEIKRAWNPKTGYDIRGASYERLRETSLQWPCAMEAEQDRNPIRYLNNGISQDLKRTSAGEIPQIVFPTENGKAVFLPRPHLPPAEMPDAGFPFVLNTGRLQHQWHTMTKTGKIPTLNKLNPGPFIEIHPEDAAQFGIQEKQPVEISSIRGRAVLPAVITNRVRPGNCFAPFHWNDVFGEDLAINAVTSDAVDPISLQPEFKFCAVALTPVPIAPPPSKLIETEKKQPIEAHYEPALTAAKELDMKQIDSLAHTLGLDKLPAIELDAHEQLYMQGYITGLRSDGSRQVGGVPVLPATAPLTVPKRLLLDGLLAGLFARTWIPEMEGVAGLPRSEMVAAVPAASPIVILWASQTGNSEGFAERCASQLKAAGQDVTLACMDSFAPQELAQVSRLIVMTSTFGDGDPPDNGTAFWQALESESMPRLEKLSFSVLAFGDSNYDQFCGFGRKLDQRLEALGAQRLLPRVDCEPEFQEPAERWLQEVLAKLVSVSTKSATLIPVKQLAVALAEGDANEIEIAPSPVSPENSYSRAQPLVTRLLVNNLLNEAGAEKETRQFGFDLTATGFTYEAGDALGVWPTQCPEQVAALLAVTKLSGATPVTLKDQGEIPLEQALLRHFEITKINSELLHFVAAHWGASDIAELLKPERKEALKDWLWGRQILDVLRAYPIKADAAQWLSVLKRLQPRLYSISSSPKVYPDQVQLTVSTVRYAFDGARRGGVCSTFLADRAKDAAVPIFLQKSAHFRLPKDLTKPVIMVGPGTGIAPFRAFLQERQATAATGKNWLFFGEQRMAIDFYYRNEIEIMLKNGLLNRIDTAFSRDQSEKIYVQHRMIEQGAELWRWLDEGAHFYVCGDASRMAKDVDKALKQIIRSHGGLSKEGSENYVANMTKQKRYLRDVY